MVGDSLRQEQLADIAEFILDDQELASDYSLSSLIELIYSTSSNELFQACENELVDTMKLLVDPVLKDGSMTVPIDGCYFVVTGEFDYGNRAAVCEAIRNCGGIAKDKEKSTPKKTDYEVVGNQQSPKWKFVDYGGKVEKAIDWQLKGECMLIISEDILMRSLEAGNNNQGVESKTEISEFEQHCKQGLLFQ